MVQIARTGAGVDLGKGTTTGCATIGEGDGCAKIGKTEITAAMNRWVRCLRSRGSFSCGLFLRFFTNCFPLTTRTPHEPAHHGECVRALSE